MVANFVGSPSVQKLRCTKCRESNHVQSRHIALSRVAELALGHSANQVMVYGFDYLLYPYVVYRLGLGLGFVVMSLLSLVTCWVTLAFYDWSKRDWLGIEAVKSVRHYDGSRVWIKTLAGALQRGDPIACVILSIKYDPFIVTVYLRRGEYGTMTRRDWRNFWLSWIISNAYWSVVCFTGVSAFIWLWTWIRGSM